MSPVPTRFARRAAALGWVARVLPVLWLACGDAGPPPAVGTLERDRLDLVAEVSEPVVARPVEEGDFVDAGTLLVELDRTRTAAQVAQAEGARDRAAARLAELVRGPRREQIAAARARASGTAGRLTTARSDLARAQDLFGQGVISQGKLDEQRARYDEAEASHDAALAQLRELLEGTTPEELAQAEAVLSEAESALADARVRLDRLEVRAPTAGWIDALPYEIGEQPPPGGVVAVLLAGEAPYARVYVPEAIRARVRPGLPARVVVDGLDAPLSARVRTVAREASFTPFFALTERDRGRLVYPAELDLEGEAARGLPTGVPVVAHFELAGGEPGHVTAGR